MVAAFDSERRALLSRITQAKTAIERVMDRLDGTFEPALSLAMDRLIELREHYEVKEEDSPGLPAAACAGVQGVQRA